VEKHYDSMSEDYNCNNPSPDLVYQIVLIDIRNMLQSMGKDIRSFPLPDIDHSYDKPAIFLVRYLRKLASSRISKICYCATHSMSSKGLPTMR
jgi:hypothetical protein